MSPALTAEECFAPDKLHVDRDVGNAGGAEDAAIALDFRGRSQRLGVVVGEFHGGTAIDFAELADQADGVKAVIAARIAITEIVGEVRSPTGAEADAMSPRPFAFVEKIGGAMEIAGAGVVEQRAGEAGVKSEDAVHIETIGSDQPLSLGIAAAALEPLDVF